MPECVVIADDLTGGNATGVLMTKMNYRAHSILNLDAIRPEALSDCDCVIYPTNSRSLTPETACERVTEACRHLAGPDVKVYSHRIDSTMRGNMGIETDAMLDYLGEDYVAVVAPCWPSTGRIVCGGYVLVDGIPIHKSAVAVDPKCPVKQSNLADIFRSQSRYGVAPVYIDDMMHGKHYLAKRMRQLVEEGNRTLTFDCITQEDLDLIADACITSKLKIVAVDPGVFTATLARKIIKPRKQATKSKILAVVGSVHPNAKVQLEQLWLSQRTYNVLVETRRFLDSKSAREHEIDRAVQEVLTNCEKNQISTVVGDGIYPENRIDFGPYMDKMGCSLEEVTTIINRSLAEIAYRIFKAEPSFEAIYTSGGDVTISVCERFGAAGLRLRDEVLPLAAYGKFLEGEFDGKQIITKGGSQGGPDAINQCITYLKEKLFI